MSEELLKIICTDIKRWVNHTKEGSPRSENDLIYFDQLWNSIVKVIIRLQNQIAPLDEEEKDIVSMLRYEGTLYRIHKIFKRNSKNYGVVETDHFVSWTKTYNFDDLYWFNRKKDYVCITAETKPELFAIDLVGFQDYVKKHYYPNYSLGSPALLREQEVVFPIKFSTVQRIAIHRLR